MSCSNRFIESTELRHCKDDQYTSDPTIYWLQTTEFNDFCFPILINLYCNIQKFRYWDSIYFFDSILEDNLSINLLMKEFLSTIFLHTYGIVIFTSLWSEKWLFLTIIYDTDSDLLHISITICATGPFLPGFYKYFHKSQNNLYLFISIL